MANATPVKTTHQARLSKLQSKKRQLEQLLRKKARLDFEIQTLKKSISKEQKRTFKEVTEFNKNSEKKTSREVILQESLDLTESEDPEEAFTALLQLDKELDLILQLLLEYNEV